MFRRWMPTLAAAVLGCILLSGWTMTAQAQTTELNRFYYYPYYYYPHNYWPANSPRYPEPVGAPYMPPPAYMAYPPFKQPGWRYDLFEPHKYYRGSHFWLDQF